MIIGIVTWLKSYNKNEQIVGSNRLPNIQLSIISSIMILLCIIFGYYINNYADNTQPYMDAFSAIPTFIAQTLLMLRYREQWIF